MCVCTCKWSAHCGGLWAVRVCEPAQLITAFRSLSAARLIKPNNTIGFIGNDCALLQSLHNYWSLIVRLWEHMCTSSVQQNVKAITPKPLIWRWVISVCLFCNLTEMLFDESNPATCECSVCKAPLPVTQKPNRPHDKTALCSFEQISNHQSFYLYLQHPCFFIFTNTNIILTSQCSKSEPPINQTHKKLKCLHREVC